MDKKLHKKLIKDIESLRSKVSSYSSNAITVTVALYLRKQIFSKNTEYSNKDTNLVSPAKQCFYLLGIMLTTPEPVNPRNLDERAVKQLIALLNNIFDAYAWMFWPSKEEKDNLTQEWYRCREVAMPTFLHYFNTSLIASVEQIKQRVIEYIQPFDDVLNEELGLSSFETIRIVDRISNLQQAKLDELYELAEKERKLRLGILDRAQVEGWDIKKLRQETHDSEYAEFIPVFLKKMDMLFSFNKSSIAEKADTLSTFFTNFSIKRNKKINFIYITEDNPAESYPLFANEANSYFCPSINALYIAVFKRMETIILNSSKKDSFLRARDKTLEKSGAKLFLQLIGNDSQCFYGLFETDDLHNEHDILIIRGRNLYIIEAKASPPIEPFRDPEKAYTRLKRHFKSDKGIQKGFEQANRILKRLQDEGSFWLYNSRAEKALELKFQDFDQIFCICLTRDDYGPIATNLNLLLEKNSDDIYPWVINIYDLETLVSSFKHLGLEEANLTQYIKQRLQLHGKVFGTDEMEYLGFFIRHGSLPDPKQIQADILFLEPNYSDIFDEIYIANQSGDKVTVDITKPVFNDFREFFADIVKKQKRKEDTFKKNAADRHRKRIIKLTKLSRRKNRKGK